MCEVLGFDIWLAFGKILVNLLHLVKRTNAPLPFEHMASATGHAFSCGRFESHHP